MNVKALILTGASVGVAVVSLVALNLIAPISHAEEKHPQGISADAVFGASISEPGTSAPSPAPTTVDVAMADTAAAGQESAPESAPVETASAFSAEPTTEVAAMQDDSAVEPAVEEPAMDAGEAPAAAGAGSCSAAEGVSGAPVVVKAAGYPGDGGAAPAESGDAASAPAAEQAEPAVADTSSFSEPAAEPAPAAKPKAKPKAPKAAPPEAKLAWWPAKTDGKLNLTYAGEASFTKAIVLLFDGNFESPESANQNIKVTTKDGSPVAGQWLVAKGNPQMLLFNVAPGLYKVSVGSGLSDKGGRALGAASSGQVFVP